ERMVCGVAYAATRNSVLSEDVAQETFLIAWRDLARLADATRLCAWICGIARKLGHRARQRNEREPLTEVDLATCGPDPFDTLSSRETETLVGKALGCIPAKYAEVLVLHYREERSARQIGEMLGLSEAAVLKRMIRGRRYLAASIADLVERSLA